MSGRWVLLRTRRWIGLTALALLVVTLFVAASIWQYQRTQDQLTVARAAVAQPASYESIVSAGTGDVPLEGLGRQVVVTGTVVPDARSFVRSRLSPTDEIGFWVVDGVRLADGRVVPVLQGWVAQPRAAPELAGHRVELLGRLQPDENFYAGAPVPTTGPLLTITEAGLAGQWGTAAQPELAPGYVTVTGSAAAEQFETVRPVIGSDPDVPFPLQNAFYSLQWLVFAGVVVVVWVRWLREETAERGGDGDPLRSGDAEQRASLERWSNGTAEQPTRR